MNKEVAGLGIRNVSVSTDQETASTDQDTSFAEFN